MIGFGFGAVVDLFVINDNLVNNFFLLFIPKQIALLGFFYRTAQCYERFTAVTSYADGDGATLRAYLRS